MCLSCLQSEIGLSKSSFEENFIVGYPNISEPLSLHWTTRLLFEIDGFYLQWQIDGVVMGFSLKPCAVSIKTYAFLVGLLQTVHVSIKSRFSCLFLTCFKNLTRTKEYIKNPPSQSLDWHRVLKSSLTEVFTRLNLVKRFMVIPISKRGMRPSHSTVISSQISCELCSAYHNPINFSKTAVNSKRPRLNRKANKSCYLVLYPKRNEGNS